MPRQRDDIPLLSDAAELHGAVLRWFAAHRRPLAGRETREPWRVLVIEVMSQQTQIERSLLRAEAFCERYPAPEALARASAADVVRAWAGLGYNRRALALREAARAIVEHHGGRVPSGLPDLVALPGIGPYTARAVAARSHGAAVMPIDVNVRRVLGRLMGTARPAEMQALGDAIAGALPAADPPAHPGDVADALMDVAAGVCRPRDPVCVACPLRPWCAWHARAAAAALEPDVIAARPARGSRQGGFGTPFPETRRWLRGQLLRELREQPAGAWSSIEGERGAHGHAAVREVLGTLADEGFVEIDERGRARLAED